jgi:hypothetical protein
MLFLASASSVHAAWYNANWQYREKLPIDYTKVGATLHSFPVVLSLPSDSDVAAFPDLCKNTWPLGAGGSHESP